MQTFEEVLTHFHSFLESATYLDVVPCRWGYVRLFNEGNPINFNAILCRTPQELYTALENQLGNRLNWYKIGLLLGSFWYSDFEKYAILYHKQNIFRDFQSYCKTLSDALPVCGSSPLRSLAPLLDRKDRFD